MSVFIDPPVSAYSMREQIEEWVRELGRLKVTYRDDAAAMEAIERAEREARGWLDVRKERAPPQRGI